ncbi:MAG TPA: HNH endonuclease signature motif containing protein [Patescibacteria group bacterium]|nr:HNH endonuclease signature motif containing protein [Patescibacteria group bacterium]
MKISYKIIFPLLILVLFGGLALTKKPTTSPSVLGTVSTPTPVYVWAERTKESDCHASGAYQDFECSPGAILPVTVAQICTSGYAGSVRNVPESEKNAVYAEYGITTHTTGEYEIDHIVSLELGGSNDISNLFPEAAEPQPGFHQKDIVENYLHQQVCSGVIPLPEAQYKIAHDWLSVFQQMRD